MRKQTLKEVVKKMCNAMPGGRSAMAGALGMSLETFNNNLYEKNGCRFFEADEVEAMEEISGSRFLVEYHMDRHSLTPMEPIEPAKLDEVELFHTRMKLSAMQGDLSMQVSTSLADGVLTHEEMIAIYNKLNKVFAYALGFMDSLKFYYGEKK